MGGRSYPDLVHRRGTLSNPSLDHDPRRVGAAAEGASWTLPSRSSKSLLPVGSSDNCWPGIGSSVIQDGSRLPVRLRPAGSST